MARVAKSTKSAKATTKPRSHRPSDRQSSEDDRKGHAPIGKERRRGQTDVDRAGRGCEGQQGRSARPGGKAGADQRAPAHPEQGYQQGAQGGGDPSCGTADANRAARKATGRAGTRRQPKQAGADVGIKVRSPAGRRAIDPGDAVPPGVGVDEPAPPDLEAETARRTWSSISGANPRTAIAVKQPRRSLPLVVDPHRERPFEPLRRGGDRLRVGGA